MEKNPKTEKELSTVHGPNKSGNVFWSVGSVKMWLMFTLLFLGIIFGSIGTYYAIKGRNKPQQVKEETQLNEQQQESGPLKMTQDVQGEQGSEKGKEQAGKPLPQKENEASKAHGNDKIKVEVPDKRDT